ncbi:MAG: hypothetical protein IPL59_11605 [Candidatus Competibacteraceae bacterium]|nr:hypothetical protein [Candidatus Competibacteraceae bacterium]
MDELQSVVQDFCFGLENSGSSCHREARSFLIGAVARWMMFKPLRGVLSKN